jgi:hypothetical protein
LATRAENGGLQRVMRTEKCHHLPSLRPSAVLLDVTNGFARLHSHTPTDIAAYRSRLRFAIPAPRSAVSRSLVVWGFRDSDAMTCLAASEDYQS